MAGAILARPFQKMRCSCCGRQAGELDFAQNDCCRKVLNFNPGMRCVRICRVWKRPWNVGALDTNLDRQPSSQMEPGSSKLLF